MKSPADLIVLSHLRWDFVWQRPQHLLTRLAKSRRVFFVEEPLTSNDDPAWDCHSPAPTLFVCRPRTPTTAPGYHDDQMPYLDGLVEELLNTHQIRDYIAWFYTPMAVPLLGALRPSAVVYDCMDELSAFHNAPPQMIQREADLLRGADVVFTGGPSLYRSKKDRHPNVHCFPSSVDLAHFSQARESAEEHPDQACLPHPRLGFFGVIDERLDVRLLGEMAQARPDWQITLVGPVVKISADSLPRLSNIHYFGQRSYAELPAFLAGWDVCLLPFARNDATRFISPTKTLEYMAAERPIVSTRIADVAGPYSNIVYLADSADEFIAACERALIADSDERSQRTALMRSVLAKTSWDQTANSMNDILNDIALQQKPGKPGAAPALAAGRRMSSATHSTSCSQPNVIIGAGPTGLSAAYHLGEQSLLLEQNDRVGGWCRSVELNGFTFDYAGHIMFSNDSYVHEMYNLLLSDNVHWQNREAWVFSKNIFTRYPFQGALYGLPADVIKECILGAIESRFGPLKQSSRNASLIQNMATGNGNGNGNLNGSGKLHAAVKDCCADGMLESTAHSEVKPGGGSTSPDTSQNFEDFIYQTWGTGIAKHFAIPYNRKLWAVPLSEMETSWLGGRVPLPDLEEMIEGALRPVAQPMGPNARFGYPLRGGFQALMDGFLPHLKGEVRLGCRVAKVSSAERLIQLHDGTEIPYQNLISTMPLPVLIRVMGNQVPEQIRQAAAALRHVSVRCVHLGVGRPNLTEKHWIYYPEDTVFHRIFVQGNASPHCNPPGGFGITCEITYHTENKPLPCDGDDLIRQCIDDCCRVGLFKSDDPILAATQVDLPHAYVVYDHARRKNVALIREWLKGQDILLAGRYSEWEYYNSDHAFLAGKKAAENVRDRAGASDQLAVL